MMTFSEIDRRISKAANELSGIVRRGILRLIASNYFAQIEAEDGEIFDDVEMWQQFGFTSRPPAGGEVCFVKVNNAAENAIAIATQDRDQRPDDLATGDAVMYSNSSPQVTIACRTSGLAEFAGNTDFMIRGTQFYTDLNVMLGSCATAFTALMQPGAAAAINTFLANQANHLSTKAKLG